MHVHLVLRFFLISWLFINQSGHSIYLIKAEYLSYRMVPVILLLVKEFKIYVLKRTKIYISFQSSFLTWIDHLII